MTYVWFCPYGDVMSDPISVIPMMESWQITQEQYAITGTKVYIEDLGDSALAVDLPNIGDSWDDGDYVNLLLISKQTTYTGDYYKDADNRCARKFLCTYSGSTYIQTADALSSDDLPMSLSTGAQITNFEPNPADNIWKWDSDNEPVAQVIGMREVITNIQFVRAIKDFSDFNTCVQQRIGQLNASEFKGYPIGTVLFEGVDLDEYRNANGRKRWRATLKFTARRVTYNDAAPTGNNPPNDGWCHIIRDSTGVWDVPYWMDGGVQAYSYLFADFNVLFTIAPLGDDEETIVNPPET